MRTKRQERGDFFTVMTKKNKFEEENMQKSFLDKISVDLSIVIIFQDCTISGYSSD